MNMLFLKLSFGKEGLVKPNNKWFHVKQKQISHGVNFLSASKIANFFQQERKLVKNVEDGTMAVFSNSKKWKITFTRFY